MKSLLQMLRIALVPNKCIHLQLEQALANPFIPPDITNNQVCGNACSFCTNDMQKNIPKINKEGMIQILLTIFLHPTSTNIMCLKKGIIEEIWKYPNCNKILFRSKSTSKPKRIVIERLVLFLVAVNILNVSVVYDKVNDKEEKPIVTAYLSNTNGNLHLCQDNYRLFIRTK
mmetsp:Transcript_9600/g.13600  ORF Transcript_9600/g.13600 Transcript_9600/m.13600 type:complete len:172 (-) Transcript_9600:499-1014(-)